MRLAAKIGWIAGGYAAAVAIAAAAVGIHMAATGGEASGGMQAFGDGMLFLAVFAVAAVAPSGAVLYLLRSWRAFWPPFSVAAVAVAATGLAALIVYVGARGAAPGSVLNDWSGFAVLRILLAPCCSLGFLVSGLFAPIRSSRIALFGAAVAEGLVFTCISLMWFQQFLSR